MYVDQLYTRSSPRHFTLYNRRIRIRTANIWYSAGESREIKSYCKIIKLLVLRMIDPPPRLAQP